LTKQKEKKNKQKEKNRFCTNKQIFLKPS